MRITLTGNPATKKNSQRIVHTGRYMKLLPSKAYVAYEKDCLKQIAGDVRLGIDYPVNVQCTYFMKTRRKVDLTNLMEATHDILVKAGVLSDDNSNVITSVDGSRVKYDKDNPRVEIVIESMNQEEEKTC